MPNFDEDECNGCKKCSVVTACPMKACKVEDGVLEIDEEICNHCGRCVENVVLMLLKTAHGYKISIGGRWGKKVKTVMR